MYTVIKNENAKTVQTTSTAHGKLTSVRVSDLCNMAPGTQIKPNHYTTPHVFEVLACEKVTRGYELVLIQLDKSGNVLEGAEPFMMYPNGGSTYKLISA